VLCGFARYAALRVMWLCTVMRLCVLCGFARLSGFAAFRAESLWLSV